MSSYANRVRVYSSTTGTPALNSASIALGAAYSSAFATPADANCVDGTNYTWCATDGNNFVIFDGVWNASGDTITPTKVWLSKSSGTAGASMLSFSGGQQIEIVCGAEAGFSFLDFSEQAIASAATADLSTINQSRIEITGTTTITSFGVGKNLLKFVRFADALTLTYNATSLILPGAANITTAAGDTAMVASDGSGNWRCLAYHPVSGLAPATDTSRLAVAGGTMAGALNWNAAATLASASTVNIGAASSNYVKITGTTTITAFDTIAQGAERTVEFGGVLTLTYNATSLILPGAANITTAAGDTARFISEGSGNWRCLAYHPVSGLAPATDTSRLAVAGGTMTGALNWNAAATLASASTVNIGAASSNYVKITGTTTITAFDTIAQGAERTVEFGGVLTLTYNATSLILPGAANITTAAGDTARFISEGSGNWRCVSYLPAAIAPGGSSVTLRGYLSGLTLSNDGVTPNTIIDIAAGVACSDDFTTPMTAAALTKTTGSWAVGSGNGGLDAGTVAASTWYHVFLIKRTDTGVVDALISTSATAPTLPTGYTKQRRIGSFKTDASSHIITFTQQGDEFLWKTPIQDMTAVASSTTAASRTLTVPSGLEVRARFTVRFTAPGNATTGILFYALDTGTQAANTPTGLASLEVTTTSVGGAISGDLIVRTNTSAQIGVVSDTTSGSVYLVTYGWFDRRGRDA